jgi:GNAT superfamily N-acetyltransferase
MPSKTNYKDFSARIRVKYPEYGNMDDLSLAKMWVEQNPQYGEFVVFDEPTPQKKSPVGTTPGQPVGSELVSSGDPIADRAQTQSAIKGYAKNKDKAEEIGFWENLGLNFANGSNRLFNDAFQTAYEGSLAMQGVPAAGIQGISKYKSRPLKEDFRTKTRQDMGLLEESTAAFANSLPIMLSSMAMGGAANIATRAGKVAGALPSFISGFQESGREADEIGIKDPLDRIAFQTAGGGMEFVSEYILPDASLIRPLRQRALKDLVRVGGKGLSKADVGRYVAEFTEKVAKEVGEEYAVEVGQALRGVSFAVAGYDSAMPEMKSARDYAVMTLSAAFGAGTFSGVGTLADAAYAKSSAIKKASENPEAAAQAVADLIDAGKLTEEQGNEFLTKVNMLSRTSSRMPKNIDPEVAVNSAELLNQKMDIEEQINALEEEKKGIDDSFVPEIDTQIASLTEQLNSLTQQISSIRPTEPEGATIELDIPDAADLSTEDQSVLDIMSSRFEEPYLNAINQRINNAEEISLSEIENIAGDMINELTVVSESQDLTDNQKQQLSQLVENQIDNLLNYEFATTTTTEQAGQKTKAAGIVSTPREGRPLPESKVSRERFEGAGVRIGGRGAGRITVKPIAGFGGRSVYGISFGNRKGVTPVEDLEFDNLEFVAPVILEDGSFNARMRDSKTGLELTITDPELSIDLAIAESLRQAGKTTFPQPAFLEAFNEVTKGTPTRTTTSPNIGRTGTAPEAAGVQPQTEQDVRQETNVTQERGDEGEASSRLPQEEGRQEGQVTPAVEGEAQASPTAKKKKTAQERADEQKATLEKLKETLKSLKAKPGGKTNIDLTFGVVPITKAVWNTAIDTAILAIDAGQTLAQAVKAASDYISSQIQGDWGKGKFESYINDRFAPSGEFLTIFNASPKELGDLGKRSGVAYFATDEKDAKIYADMNRGKVREFKIKKSDVSTQDVVLDKIKELGLKPKDSKYTIDEALPYELIDDRFDNSLSQSDINRLFNELKKDGVKAFSYDDGGLGAKETTQSVAIIDQNTIVESAVEKAQEKPTTQPDVLKDVESTAKALEAAKEDETVTFVDEFINGEKVTRVVSKILDIIILAQLGDKRGNISVPSAIPFLPKTIKSVHLARNENDKRSILKNGFDEKQSSIDSPIPGVYFSSDDWSANDRFGREKKDALYVSIKNEGLVYFDDVDSFVDYLEENNLPNRGQTLTQEQLNKLKSKGVKGILLREDFASESRNELIVIDSSIIENISDNEIPITELPSSFSDSRKMSEAYHKAKKDGSNPELVEAVEDLLGAKAEPTTEKTGTKAGRAEYGKMKDSFFGGIEPNKNRLFFADATNDFQYRGDNRADIVLMLDGANFWLTEGPDGYVTIEDFQVSEDKLGTGKGKFALSKLIEYADRNGITLIGEPLAQAERKRGRAQKGLSQKQLIEFYKKNGFEKISKDSLSKNRTAEANYLERKPKDSVEKTETEKPIAESRREFREKARKYFDGLKKLGFAFDAERNAKEDIAFLKALKNYIKLEIDNGMVTFKGFIEKTANLIEGFNEKDIASAAKKMWAEEIVKAYPKIYSKLQKAKKDLLDKEIQEARVTLQNSLKELLSDKKIFRKISSLTTERKLDKLSSDILVGMREEIEALGGLKKLSDEDLLFYNEMATQAYKEGQVIQGELINALKAKKEADKKNAKSAITNQDERSVVELKDANEAREFLSKNKGNNSNQVNINNGEIIVDSVEEFDILSSMFDKRTTFGGTTTAPNPNNLKRGKGSFYRTTVGGGLIYLLDKFKGKTPSQETINFWNELQGQVKSATFRKKRLNAELNNNRTSNISFLFKNRFAYTRRMLSTPRINGEKLVINDQNGSEIKNLSINHVLFFYQLMKDPHFLEGVKKKDGKIARKIGLEEQSMRDIIDFVNLEENSDLRELMSNDQVLIKRAAQNAAHVMEASNISSEMLNPRPLNLSAYENDQFIGEILNKIYNNSVPTEIEYFPSSVESDTNDQTPDVDALLGEDLGGKTVSAMSRFMIEREVGGTVKVKSYDAQLGEYFESMSNTAAKLPILKRFQAIFNKENTDLISSYYGKNTTNELKENIARYIVGRPQDAWLSKTISEGVLGKWLSLGLGIQMFLNLATALSQLSSSPGPILAYGVGNYLNGLSMLISGEADFKDSLLSLSSGKLFRERLGSRIDAAAIVKSIPSDERGYAAYFNEFNKKLISFGSAASSYFDAASILLSLPIYAREYSNARRTMTDQEAKDYAEEKIMDLAELFLQTRNEEMISSAESRYRTTLYSFATIVPQLHRQAIMAAKRIQRNEGDVKQNLSVLAWSAIGSSVAFRLLRPYFESLFEGDDEDEELKNLRSDKRTKRVALDLTVDATKSFGLYGAVSSAILKTGYQLVEAEEDASKVRMALDITPEIIESIPSVSIKLRNINDAIKSYYDDENLKGTTQGIQALTGLPIEKARMFAVQMSDGFLSDQFSMAEKVARISGFISENKAKEKLFQKAMSTDPLLREKLSPSEIQRFTTKQKNEYKSATSIIAKQYSEATTESEREAAISRLISLQSGATKYDNAEELVNQIQDDFDKKVYENMLPKEFLEIKKMPSTKKVNFVANEFNATKNEQEAIDYLETLSAYGVISDNEKSEIVEILLKSNKAK